jgi:serine/threonine protein kinase
MPDLVGKILANQYHLQARLGEGSMALVYRAEDRVRGCLVAVKVMKAHHLDDPATFRRFRREAESLACLEHPHIVRFYELVTKTESPFLVMDYIEGENITQWLDAHEGEPLPLSQALQILYQVGGALHFAHQRGILHRDIKPSNILIDRGGKAYLTDFGIALLTGRTRLTHDRTEPGVGPGTPVYMAPEQWLGEEPDARTDVYALGALLYELLTGRPPFVSEDPGGLAYQHLHESPEPPSQQNPDIPRGVEWVILKALKKKQDERYQDVATMLEALRTAEKAKADEAPVLSKHPSRMRGILRPLVLSMGVILVLLAVLAVLFWVGPWHWPWEGSSETTPMVALGVHTATLVPLAVTPTPTFTPVVSPVESPILSPTALPIPSPSPTPTPSPTPAPSPTPTPLPSPTPIPHLTVEDDHLNVYAGPGEGYEVLGQVRRGDKLSILGRSEDGEWWQVNYLGWKGWIVAQSATASLELQALPVAEAPPIPVNRRPNVQGIEVVSTIIETWDTITLTCQAADPDGDELAFYWETTGGSISGEGSSVSYYAPGSLGSQTITVTVRDGHGGEAEHSILVQVLPAHPPSDMSEPVGVFRQIWRESQLLGTLGWATSGENVTLAAQQVFEKGIMFWRDDNDDIYVLVHDSSWTVHQDDWSEAADEYSCPDVSPRNTPPTPKRGFGSVWCKQLGGPNAAIGWAATAEEGYDALWQSFEHGLMWQGKDGQAYVLLDAGTWHAYSSP